MTIAILLKGYPRLSETFIAQEIRALEQAGLPLALVSLRHPTDRARHPIHAEIRAPVTYLPEYLYREPLRVLKGLVHALRHRAFRRALRAWLGDLGRDFSANRGRRFGQALVLARELPKDTSHLYAHFLHTPASVAYYTHLLTGLPWSCSAHAKDIWTIPNWEKREKLASLDWLVTCTRTGAAHLHTLTEEPEKITLLYHGLDFARFSKPDPRVPSGSPVILTIGRAVEKKGLADLLDALALLPRTLRWRLVHIGGGPLLPALRERATRLGLADKIEWRGAQPQDQVLAAYRAADIFVLASKVAADGDRDGLPNVLMEAQSQNLPVIATDVGGIPELVIAGRTGLLVPPGDPQALAQALARLLNDGEMRRALGEAGFARVRGDFCFRATIGRLIERFTKAPAG
ncbi:MAG TPA: glycosyltransferase [Dongiaceae bacterium]|jgi:glycosyltransferase involved in cell wall biosynthesis|nr:glycosyltransferase [Dongiaceae bacterium]